MSQKFNHLHMKLTYKEKKAKKKRINIIEISKEKGRTTIFNKQDKRGGAQKKKERDQTLSSLNKPTESIWLGS